MRVNGIDGKPHITDIRVGARVRLRRRELLMSQEHLSKALGKTFQQVQKYENGTNRIGASVLWEIAQELRVPVDYFFEGEKPAGENIEADEVMGFLATIEGLHLNRSFMKIRDEKVRKRVMLLVRTLADDATDEAA